MIIEPSAWLMALAGGVLIGSSATMLMVLNQRIAGISGIFGGLIGLSDVPDRTWRFGFVAGLVAGGAALSMLMPSWFGLSPQAESTITLVAAGLLVGFGTQMGRGCTSGHGVCGLSRQSPRSLAATLTFMGMGVATVAALRAMGGLS